MRILLLTLLLSLFTFPAFSQYQQIIYEEDFNTCGLPAGWQATKQNPMSHGWQIGNATSQSSAGFQIPDNGSCFAAMDDSSPGNPAAKDVLTSPVIDLSTATNPKVIFDVYVPQSLDFFGHFKVDVLQNGTVVKTIFSNFGEYYSTQNWQRIEWPVTGITGSLSQISFSFVYSDFNFFENPGAAFDNFQIVQPHPDEISISHTNPISFYTPGTYYLKGNLTNRGQNTVSIGTVNWQIDFNTPQSVRLTGLNNGLGLSPESSQAFSIPNAFSFSSVGTYQLKVWTSLPNDRTDPYLGNDTFYQEIQVVNYLPEKRILIEKYTDIHCPPCYDSDAHINSLLANHPTATAISVFREQNNPLNIPAGDTLTRNYIWAWPTILIDRHDFFFRPSIRLFSGTYLDYDVSQRSSYKEAVEVKMENPLFNPVTREMKVELVATFYGDYDDQLAFNLAIIEDSMFGYQVNAPDPNNYWHMHVLREFMGGAWGVKGSLPSSVRAGQTFRHAFTFTLPMDFKAKDIQLLALLQRKSPELLNREIINTSEPMELLNFTNDIVTQEQQPFILFPQPAQDVLHIKTDLQQYQVGIFDLQGREVISPASKPHQIHLKGLSRGIYLVKIEAKGKIYHQKITIE